MISLRVIQISYITALGNRRIYQIKQHVNVETTSVSMVCSILHTYIKHTCSMNSDIVSNKRYVALQSK